MKSPANHIADKIATLLHVVNETSVPLGWEQGVNMFIGNEPSKPDSCITIYDTGGVEQSAGLADDMVTVQIRHRCPDYGKGYANLQEIRLALEGITPYSNSEVSINGIWVQSPVANIGKDVVGHSLFTLNLRILMTPSNSGNRRMY